MINAYIALIFGIFALSFSSLYIHWSSAPGVTTSFFRMLFASLTLLPVYLLLKNKEKIRWKLLLFPIGAGIFTSLDHAFWSTAINTTNIANATLFNNISPIWVALFSAFVLKEKLTSKYFIGLILAILGIGLIYGNNLINNPKLSFGDGLALTSSIFYAGYFLIARQGRKKLSTLEFIFLVNVTATVALLIITRVYHLPLSGYLEENLIIYIGAAIISQIGGYFSITFALGHLPASYVSLTMIAQPVITAILAIPFAGEILSENQIIGGLLILIGIFAVNTTRPTP